MVIKKHKTILKCLCLFLILIISFCINSSKVHAGYVEEGGSEGSGGTACQASYTLCTSYGAGWEYLSIAKIKRGEVNGVGYNEGNDTVTMYGASYEPAYAHTTTISGCAKMGGLYRFAMVSTNSDHNKFANGSYIKKNDFVGAINPRSSSDANFTTTKLNGYMTYKSNISWDTVASHYKDATGKSLSSSPVAAFCYWEDECTGCCPGDPYYPTCEEPEPPAPVCGQDTSVTVKQKNSSSNVSAYRNWTTSKIYAKPTDQIDYTYTYCAGVQSQAFDTVTYSEGSHGCDNTSNDNRDFSDAITWNNYYNVSEPHGFTKRFTFSIGDVTESDYSHNFNVASGDVGSTLTSTITSSYPSSASSRNDGIHEWSKVCSWDCECGDADEETGKADSMNCACDPEDFAHTNNYYPKSASGPDSESVNVRIPYNFEVGNGSVNIQTNTFYAGETFTLSDIKIDVIPIYSSTLNETYATKTQPATINLYSYYVTPSGATSSPVLMDTANPSTMNANSNLSGITESFFGGRRYSIYDIPAGSNMCLYYTSSIRKSSSSPDANSTEGTYTSPTSCKVIYKKPSFQVWGGSIYTGSSSSLIAYKNNLQGYYNFKPQTTTNNTVFGSWAEYAVVYGKEQSSATQSGIASGASTAYTTNNNGSLVSNPGGSKEPGSESYCKRSPLTISNTKCTSNIVAKSGISAGSSVTDAIYNTFVYGRSLKPASGNVDLSSASVYNENDHIRYTTVTGGSNLSSSSSLPVRITHIIYSTGTVTITNNLTYENTVLTSISQMPQYIIYAKDINILCGVSRIDAWLIAKNGTINTCSDGGDDNSAARSNQLIVNGPVIANQADLGRTYGASTGNKSGIAAEIFNLTPMTNMWSESGASNTPTLYSQYTRELAPRY